MYPETTLQFFYSFDGAVSFAVLGVERFTIAETI